jgi:hypothetical protein
MDSYFIAEPPAIVRVVKIIKQLHDHNEEKRQIERREFIRQQRIIRLNRR